jgi:hypothetical protein
VLGRARPGELRQPVDDGELRCRPLQHGHGELVRCATEPLAKLLRCDRRVLSEPTRRRPRSRSRDAMPSFGCERRASGLRRGGAPRASWRRGWTG